MASRVNSRGASLPDDARYMLSTLSFTQGLVVVMLTEH